MLSILQQLVSRTQRNHALEHATINVLSERHKQFSAQGNSNHRGFHLNIYGNIAEEDVEAAAKEAYARMKNGEHHLGLHPNCGTVLLTTATMGALASQLAFALEQRRQRESRMTLSVLFNGLPSAILAGVMTLIISRPVGMAIQDKFTTNGELGDLRIKTVEKIRPSVVTRLFQMLLTPGKDVAVNAYRVETSDQ